MRKLRFLFVLLAMVSLASCNYEEEAIRYEVTSENPNECYVAEIVPKRIKYYNSNEDITNDKETYKKVRTGGTRHTLEALLVCSGSHSSNDVMYNISMPADESSLIIKYKEKKGRLSTEEFKSVLDNYIKHSGITADTTYKPSYRLIVTDSDKFTKATNVDQSIHMATNYSKYISDDSYYTRITNEYQPDSINDLVQCGWMLQNNLETFHHIPIVSITNDYWWNYKFSFTQDSTFHIIMNDSGSRILIDGNDHFSWSGSDGDDNFKLEVNDNIVRYIVKDELKYEYDINKINIITPETRIKIKPEFYYGQKSVEEVNEMLSEYGLSLEPTGKEKMVITFSTDKTIESAKLFESKSYTNKFFAVLFVGILFCVFATMHVSKKEALAPKSKSVIRVGSAILLWVLAALCFLLFISIFGIAALFTEAELHDLNWNDYLINSRSLAILALGFIFTATGISVFNYRKSYYTISGKILRVLFTICVFGLMFNIIENIINSDFDLVGPLFVCIALGGMMRKQKIENNK